MLKARSDILRTALAMVPQHGFSDTALTEAAAKLGLSPMCVGSLFARGPVELVEFTMQTANQSVALELQKMREADATTSTPSSSSTSPSSADIVVRGLQHRIECLRPFAEHWPVAAALTAASPVTSLPRCALYTAHLVDEIAFHADKSHVPDHGVGWYARRAALAGLYTAAELHMMGDTSANKQQTMDFIRVGVKGLWC
eukprot:PhM_4_TR12710/c0_g1_i1/m.35592/K18587/COQ9; ubiquinone biosynthesis protein COQ9